MPLLRRPGRPVPGHRPPFGHGRAGQRSCLPRDRRPLQGESEPQGGGQGGVGQRPRVPELRGQQRVDVPPAEAVATGGGGVAGQGDGGGQQCRPLARGAVVVPPGQVVEGVVVGEDGRLTGRSSAARAVRSSVVAAPHSCRARSRAACHTSRDGTQRARARASGSSP